MLGHYLRSGSRVTPFLAAVPERPYSALSSGEGAELIWRLSRRQELALHIRVDGPCFTHCIPLQTFCDSSHFCYVPLPSSCGL